MSSGNLERDGLKVFQTRDSATHVGLLGIKLKFSFKKNIVATMSLGLRDDHVWVR